MSGILRWLGIRPPDTSDPSADTDSVRRIVARLDDMPEDRARFAAAFAYLLSRVARADLVIDPDETAEMERLIVERGHLDPDQAVLVVQMAKTQNRLFGGTENYLVAKEFGKLAGHDQKLALVDCLFAVSAAGGTISAVEDGVIRQIADELRLEHRDYIEVRSRWRDRLAVLQRPETPEGG